MDQIISEQEPKTFLCLVPKSWVSEWGPEGTLAPPWILKISEDVKSKTKIANPVKFTKSKSRTNSYAESAKTKLYENTISYCAKTKSA